jgi:homopolymeric O-antigen transport system permease protein
MELASSSVPVALKRIVIIESGAVRVKPRLAELWRYRELFYFFVWRDVKVRYAQSVLGVGWAIIQPLVPMVLFTVVFGRVARISSDGVPYAMFCYVGLVPWTYFSNALADASASLVKEVNLLIKIYFPRLIIPLTAVLGRMIDLAISLLLLFVLMVWYQILPTPWLMLTPVFIVITMIAASGLGLWLSALAVQYRDVKHAVPFAIQFLMYAAPVVYPASLVPGRYRYLYGINPLVGVIEGFRACLFTSLPMPVDLIAVGAVSALIMLGSGMLYFIRKEPVFADVA